MGSVTIGRGITIFDTNSGGGGGVTGAESGTGIVAGKVRLGINPLLAFTQILGNHFSFFINGVDGSEISEAEFSIINDAIGFGTYDGAGNFKGFGSSSGSGAGTVVSDHVDHLGVTKDNSILRANQLADQNAYVTTDCLPIIVVGNVPLPGLSVTFQPATFAVVADGTYRISLTIGLVATGGGSAAGTYSYTDIAGNINNNVSFGIAVSGAHADGNFPSIVIDAKAGTIIRMTVTVIGIITYIASGIIERLR